MKVLIADDDPVFCRLLSATLQKWGYTVITAWDGDEAVSRAREHKPKVVITDIMMPKMNGYDLCRRIKADPELKGVPVILLTALSNPADVIGALQCGADGFITKPYDNAFLANCMEELIGRPKQAEGGRPDGKFEISFANQKYVLNADVKQISSLLLSTYDNALQKKLELERANRALRRAEDELRGANQELRKKQGRLENDLKAAAGIQRSLLPRDVPATQALQVAWRFQPCELIGGDIFNMVRLDERHYAFYMLDVSGHGVPSALVTVSVSQALRAYADTLMTPASKEGPCREIVAPSEILDRLDREYPIERFDKFFTIVYLVVDIQKGTLRYSNAGHPWPLLLRADGSLEKLDRGGPLIGYGAGGPFEEEEKSLQPGDQVILYTDGVLEHESAQGNLYGQQRLQQALRRMAGLPLDTLLGGLMEDVMAFGQDAPRDDITLLGIGYTGRSSEPDRP